MTSAESKLSWGNTNHKIHQTCIRKMATNDIAKSLFAGLTQQMQQFGRLLGLHASVTDQEMINGDFTRTLSGTDDGLRRLSPKMKTLLVCLALSIASDVQAIEESTLNKK